VALLPAEAAHLGHGHALDADPVQGFLHLVELEGLDHGLDLAHGASCSCLSLPRPTRDGASRA
jgi:hypothetical protein